ncbi:MAG: Na+/H+ antiporter NhaA [Burkholderiales bacterium]|nr:Na+/H+ antiporter NhaA [Burkholderiales bacterium]
MSQQPLNNRLDRPVDATDHGIGPVNAPITLVEYGSYACPHCRAANERIAQVRHELGDRLRYVFRQRPLTNNDLARRAAELVEHATTPEQFWSAHVALMTRSGSLTEEDLQAVARDFALVPADSGEAVAATARAQARVDVDVASAYASGVRFTPTFFINGRRYDGPWDESSFQDAMLGSLGHRVRAAALDFASWAPSTGILLLVATLIAIAWTNSPAGAAFEAFWTTAFGLTFGTSAFHMPVRNWVNDGLLCVFFLVVGLEIKREFTVGHLASRRSAALPIAAAIGGMVVPALLYALVIPEGPWAHGWGVPMATDTAFAIALIVMLGPRVPIELRIFLTAAAIVDDIGAIAVVAVFYSGELHIASLMAAAGLTLLLALFNRWGFYRVLPYAMVGLALWACVHHGGLHATLAGVLLALFIPTRPPPDLRTLILQAQSVIASESRHEGEVLRHGPSLPALQAIDAIHDRIESPADRLLRHVEPWSSYFVLPVFALANAGVLISMDALHGAEPLMAAIVLGLVVGKPLGLVLASAFAVRLGLADKPGEYSWLQLAGAGALAGIGFTMSLFIAGQAFPVAGDFAAAKIAVFAASVLSAVIGVGILLWAAGRTSAEPVPDDSARCAV